MSRTISLETKVKSYWTARDKNSANGLALLDLCIQRFAAHGDWDHLSRFYVGALKVGQGPAVKRIIRVAFGEHVKFSLDSKHPTGGKFTKVNWPGEPGSPFPLAQSNTYATVSDAVSKGLGWDHKIFQTELKKVLPETPVKKREVSDAAKARVVKHLSGYMSKLVEDGFSVGEILAMVQKDMTAKKVA